MHDPLPSDRVRPVSRGMHVLLYVLTALTFFAGTQLFVLSDHTDQFFSWTIANPMSAAFIGAGFWGAAVERVDWRSFLVAFPIAVLVVTALASVRHFGLLKQRSAS